MPVPFDRLLDGDRRDRREGFGRSFVPRQRPERIDYRVEGPRVFRRLYDEGYKQGYESEQDKISAEQKAAAQQAKQAQVQRNVEAEAKYRAQGVPIYKNDAQEWAVDQGKLQRQQQKQAEAQQKKAAAEQKKSGLDRLAELRNRVEIAKEDIAAVDRDRAEEEAALKAEKARADDVVASYEDMEFAGKQVPSEAFTKASNIQREAAAKLRKFNVDGATFVSSQNRVKAALSEKGKKYERAQQDIRAGKGVPWLDATAKLGDNEKIAEPPTPQEQQAQAVQRQQQVAAEVEQQKAELDTAPDEVLQQKLDDSTLEQRRQSIEMKQKAAQMTGQKPDPTIDSEIEAYNRDAQVAQRAGEVMQERQKKARTEMLSKLPTELRGNIESLDAVSETASKTVADKLGANTPQGKAAMEAIKAQHARLTEEAIAEHHRQKQARLERSWQGIQGPDGNQLGAFRLEKAGDKLKANLRLPQGDGRAVETSIEIDPPDEQDLKAEIAKTDKLLKSRQIVLAQAKWLSEKQGGEVARKLAAATIPLPEFAQKWIYKQAGAEAAAPNAVQDLEQEVAGLMQRKQALEANGKNVVMAERVVDALKKSHAAGFVGKRDLVGDFERGLMGWAASNKVAWNTLTGDKAEADEWRQKMRDLPKMFEGSSGRAFREGAGGFMREATEGLGGMTPQIVTALVGGAAGRLSSRAAAAFAEGTKGLSATSIGSMGVSAFGNATNKILEQAGALREQAKAAEQGGDKATAKSLSDRADWIEKHYLGLSAIMGGEEMLSEYLLPEEKLLLPGRKRQLLMDLGKSYAEGVAAEMLQAPVNQAIGQPTSLEQINRAGMMEAAAGAPLIGLGSLLGSDTAAREMEKTGTIAASDAELQSWQPPAQQDGTVDEQAQMMPVRAAVLRDIAQAQPLQNFNNDELAAVGLMRDPADATKIVQAKGKAGQNPAVTMENGVPIINQAAIDEVRQAFPTTGSLIAMDESEARERFVKPVEAAAPETPAGTAQPESSTTATVPTSSATDSSADAGAAAEAPQAQVSSREPEASPSPEPVSVQPVEAQQGSGGIPPNAGAEAAKSAEGKAQGEAPATPAGASPASAVESTLQSVADQNVLSDVIASERERADKRAAQKAGRTPLTQAPANVGAQKTVEAEAPKSSTQLTLPKAAAKPVVDFADAIPESELYSEKDADGNEDYGRETEPHVTVLYGLTEHDPKPVRDALKKFGPVTVTLGKLSVFENPKYDVLKVDVEGSQLREMNKALKALPNSSTFPDYKPHMTLAYLKKGEGAKYVGDTRFEGRTLTFNSVTHSPPSEIRKQTGRTEITLGDKPETSPKTSPEKKAEAKSSPKQQVIDAAGKIVATADDKEKGRSALRAKVLAEAVEAEAAKFAGVKLVSGEKGAGVSVLEDGTLQLDVERVLATMHRKGVKEARQWISAAIDEEFRHRVAMELERSDSQFANGLKELYDSLPDAVKELSRAAYFAQVDKPGSKRQFPNDDGFTARHEFFRQYWQNAKLAKTAEAALNSKGLLQRWRDLIARFIKELRRIAKGANPQVKAIADRLIEQAEAKARDLQAIQAKSAETRRRSSPRPVLGDALDVIEQAGGMMSATQAKATMGQEWWEENKSLYDDAPRLANPVHNFIYGNGRGGKGTLSPDEVVSYLQDNGLLQDGATESDMWALVERHSKSRETIRKQQGAQSRNLKEGERQAKEFSKATASGKTGVTSWDLQVGDTLDIEGDAVKVVGFDEETGDAILQDGTRFGRQRLETGDVIYVERHNKAQASTAPSMALEQQTEEQIQAERDKAKQREEIARRQAAPLKGGLKAGDEVPDMFDTTAGETPLFSQPKRIETAPTDIPSRPDAEIAYDYSHNGLTDDQLNDALDDEWRSFYTAGKSFDKTDADIAADWKAELADEQGARVQGAIDSWKQQQRGSLSDAVQFDVQHEGEDQTQVVEAKSGKTLATAPVSEDQDAAYLDAVRRGDMETAQRMVDDAGSSVRDAFLDTSEAMRQAVAIAGGQAKFRKEFEDYQNTKSQNDWYYDSLKSPGDHIGGFARKYIKRKLLAPVTRDAQGNVIPLSQRFNPQSKSILYASPPDSSDEATAQRLEEQAGVEYSDEEKEALALVLGPAWASQVEPAAEAPSETSLKNAVVDAERAARGDSPRPPVVREPWADAQTWAQSELKRYPNAGWLLMDRLRAFPYALNQREHALLIQHKVDVRRDQRAASQAMAANPGGQDAVEAKARYDRLEQEAQDIDQMSYLVGSESGRSLNIRKLMQADDFSPEAMRQKYQTQVNYGEPLTDEQKKRVDRFQVAIAHAEGKLDAVDAAAISAQAKEALQRMAQDLAKKTSKKTGGLKKAVAATVQSARERLAGMFGKKASTPPAALSSAPANALAPEVLNDLATVGIEYIEDGATDLEAFTKALKAEFGEDIEPHAEQVFKASQKAHADALAEFEGRKKPEGVLKAAKDRIKNADANDIDLKLLVDLAKAHIRSGISEAEEMVTRITKDIQGIYPGATESQVRRTLSRYGQTSTPSKDEIQRKLTEFNAQLRLISQLEDIQRGQQPLKSGFQRGPQSARVRELTGQVRDQMRRYGIKTTSEEQLADARKAVVSRLRNQIEDLTGIIEGRNKPRDPKQAIQYDDEMKALLKERNELKSYVDELTGPSPELRWNQAAQRAAKASEEYYRRKLAAGDLTTRGGKAGQQFAETPETKRAREDARRAKEEFDALREASGIPQRELLARAAKQLDDKIEAERQRLITGQKPELKPKKAPAPELAERRDMLARLREARRLVEGTASMTDTQRAELTARSLRQSIANLSDKIERRDTAPKAKAAPVEDTPEIKALREERAFLWEIYSSIKEAQHPRRLPEEIALANFRRLIERKRQQAARLMAEKKYLEIPQPDPLFQKRRDDATFELQKAKEAWARELFDQQMAERPSLRKILDAGGEVLNTARAMLTSLDFSAVLRQGGFIALGNPVRALKAFPAMFKAFASDKAQHAVMEEIKRRPNYPLYKQAKLYLTNEGETDLSKMEEAYMSRWADKIPLVAGSQRAYVTFLNKLRADTFDAMVATLGRDGRVTVDEGKALASFINVATGRGIIGRSDRPQGTPALSTVFFAPRLVASRFNLLFGQPMYGGTGRTRALVAKEYAKFVAGTALAMALTALAKDDDDKEPLISFDPRSSDFLKMRFKNTRLDFLAGLQQVTTLLARTILGETISGGKVKPLRNAMRPLDAMREQPLGDVGYKDPTAFDVAARFMRSKLSPAVGTAFNIATGKNVIGEEATPAGELARGVIPMSFQNMSELLQDQGVPRGAAMMLGQLLGIGVSTYETAKPKPKGPRVQTPQERLEALRKKAQQQPKTAANLPRPDWQTRLRMLAS